MEKYSIKKIAYLIVGLIGLALGAVGAVVPLLPAFPFLMIAAICFARGSERLNNWFIQTKLYKNNLESYVEGKGMTMRTKLRIIAIVTLTMGLGFAMMSKVPVGRIILAVVWVFHILYFALAVKTIPVQVLPAIQKSEE
ncbi:MAG: YbaN family protein [Peptostreptococcaceae bacterium]|nr:YbaN family protein [Peptostreptococcaceae bacterium]